MIYLYTGTPGSGKSLHVAKDMYFRFSRNKYKNVIANFPINSNLVKNLKNGKANFVYKDNSDLTVNFLVDYSLKNHKKGVENQCLVVIDECQVIWNAREWQSQKNRLEWIKFFTQHRKLGYNFILISQNDRMIDRQIRALVEYEVKHRKVNNFKIGKLFPFPLFAAISYWYGVNEKLSTEFFVYRKKWSEFYDSYGTWELDDNLKSLVSSSPGEGLGVPSPANKKKIIKIS